MAVDATPLALNLALISAALLGFRHGFDYDHVAAISDIASVQNTSGHAMRTGLFYALGHAMTVAMLGIAVILFQLSLPAGIDAWMQRLVGGTLLVLGAYVLVSSFLGRDHQHLPRTRVLLLLDILLWCAWRLRQMFSTQPVERRRAFDGEMGKAPGFVVGIIHGLGAETPTQLLLFLLAANLGGISKGLLGLAAFIAGMLLMNTIMCAAAAGLIGASRRRPRAFRFVAGLSAAYSIVLGAIFLAGVPTVAALVGR